MLHAVFDTNVLVSALIRRGKPRELWNAVLDGKIRLVISNELLSEFDEVITRPAFNRYVAKHRIARFRRILLQRARISQITIRFPQITADPDDNIVIEAAHSYRANYIVTGDSHLLELKRFRGIKIITVDQALRLLK